MLTNESFDSVPFLIVTGSSAGGIDALRAFIAGLPHDLDAPIVVAQHLSTERESQLQKILSFQSRFPVTTMSADEKLVAGTIYVIPTGHDATIVDAHARVTVEKRSAPIPSIDRLFLSAAEQYGDRLIAVILSGLGSDGITGARAVKEHGGTVFVQEPASASFATLPLAIPPTLIDFVARPEEMGGLVGRLLGGSQIPSIPSEQNVLHTLLLQLRDRSGIDFLQYKTPTIMRRLARLMVFSGAASLPEYMRHLQANPAGYQKLIGAFLIKVTEFFRDPELYEELRSEHLPRLIDEARQRSGELRIWSAGTSTGEEAYSLAILCAEIMREEPDAVPVRIFATDLDDEAITFSRRGVYPKDAVEILPPEVVARYFVRMGEVYEVGKRIRSMTVFGQHDLAQRSPFPRIDLCVCRNVLIYFTRELQMRALQLFAFSLRDGGLLVLGKAESTNPLPQYFVPTVSRQKIFERKGERNLIPPQRVRDVVAFGQDVRQGMQPWLKPTPAVVRTPDRPNANEIVGGILFESATGIVMLDRRYDIVAINATARSYFEIHGVGVGEDFVHLARRIDLNRLRDLVDASFHGDHPESIELQISNENGSLGQCLSVSAFASSSAVSSGDGTVLLVVGDITTLAQDRERVRERSETLANDVARSNTRIEELTRRQRTLHAANDELTVSNLDLRSQNEQLMISAEESASSSEEVETLNEEMQATNEELETLNEELQATIEELNTTNDELAARTNALESANHDHLAELDSTGAQRDALIKLAENSGIAIAVVDDLGRILYASQALRGAKFFLQPEWWRQPGRIVAVDGARYEGSIVLETSGPLPINLVTFTVIDGS